MCCIILRSHVAPHAVGFARVPCHQDDKDIGSGQVAMCAFAAESIIIASYAVPALTHKCAA